MFLDHFSDSYKKTVGTIFVLAEEHEKDEIAFLTEAISYLTDKFIAIKDKESVLLVDEEGKEAPHAV